MVAFIIRIVSYQHQPGEPLHSYEQVLAICSDVSRAVSMIGRRRVAADIWDRSDGREYADHAWIIENGTDFVVLFPSRSEAVAYIAANGVTYTYRSVSLNQWFDG